MKEFVSPENTESTGTELIFKSEKGNESHQNEVMAQNKTEILRIFKEELSDVWTKLSKSRFVCPVSGSVVQDQVSVWTRPDCSIASTISSAASAETDPRCRNTPLRASRTPLGMSLAFPAI